MKKILFTKIIDSSFINLDEQILQKCYNVKTFSFHYISGLGLILDLFYQLIFTLYFIWRTDIVYIWFADFHSVIPSIIGRLFGKKVIIVIGGYDAVYDKKLKYGALTRLSGKFGVIISTIMANKLLPVSLHTRNELEKNVNYDLSKKCEVMYNAFNSMFQCDNKNSKEDIVVTVCLTNSIKTIFIKGVDFYIDVAKELPNITFYIVGISGKAKIYLENKISDNVILIEKVPQKVLKSIYCRSKVICQFSRHEAFGVALLEGISCNCFPVGYKQAATGEILCNQGILIDELKIEKGINAIRLALNKSSDQMQEVKNILLQKYSKEKRSSSLINVIENL